MGKHLFFALLACFAACSDREADAIGGADVKEPDFVLVDHILIGVRGADPKFSRSDTEAKKLAHDLLEQIRNGGDWAKLKQKYSDDKQRGIAGGPYGMTNRGVPQRSGVAPRAGMVPAFGDVGFRLKVGEMRIADFHPTKCKWGYHIIKRIR